MTVIDGGLRIGPVERMALRTAHQAVDAGPLAPFGAGVIDTVVCGLAHAGLLADSGTVADLDRTIRALLAGDIAAAIARNGALHPDDTAQATVRRGMRAAQRLVAEGGGEPAELVVYRAAGADGITLDTYMTARAARRRCITDARATGAERFGGLPDDAYVWSVSEDDAAVIELEAEVSPGMSVSTTYTVTAVRVLADEAGAEG